MLTPEKMEQLNLVVLDTDIDAVTKEIVRSGVVHLINSSEVQPWAAEMSAVQTERQSGKDAELLRRITTLSQRADLVLTETAAATMAGKVTEEEVDNNLQSIEAALNPLLMQCVLKQEALARQEQLLDQVRVFGSLADMAGIKTRHSFIAIETGKVVEAAVGLIQRELAPIPHVLLPYRVDEGQALLLIVVLKKDKVVLDNVLAKSAWEKMDLPPEAAQITGDVQQEIKGRINKLQKDIAGLKAQLGETKTKYLPELSRYQQELRARLVLSGARSFFRKTGRSYLISGWIPLRQKAELINHLQRITEGRCYVEGLLPEQVTGVREGKTQVPVKFNNPSFLKPFEFLTAIFGLPAYKTIDPTIFEAITFFIMFGPMFGDVGHGLVLGILGILFIRSKRAALPKIGGLLIYCGISSLIFGVLYGSYFGLENIIPPLWMHPLHNIMRFVFLALAWGVIVISIGIIINIINAIRLRDPEKGIFDKAGLIGGLIYWGCIGLICLALSAKGITINPLLIISIIGVPILLLFLKGPIIKLLHPHKEVFPDGIFSYFLDTLVELMEIFIGYLANTVSFIRVAAFALAHVGLFIAVFTLVDIVKEKPGGLLYSTIILILGNILIIGLEGLIVTIQGLRLEYYEFFSKFFTGGGREYHPVKFG